MYVIKDQLSFVLVEFNEFIFANFKDEIRVYKGRALIKGLIKEGEAYRGRYAADINMNYYLFHKEQLSMVVPIYLFETFTDLKIAL